MFITTQNIFRLIEERGITPNQLAIECGLNNSAITEWKKGKANPSIKSLEKIANTYGLQLSYFYENHNEERQSTDKLSSDDDTSKTQSIKETVIAFKKHEQLENYPENLTPEDTLMFPVIGTIAAGYDGNVSYDPTGEEIPVPKSLLKTHNPNDYFVLHVVGDSMLPTYHSGDKVLIRKTDSVDSGTIAAVGFDTENATLKKVEYVKGQDWLKLIPLNPDFPVKVIKGADLDLCHIYGEFVYKFDNRTHPADNNTFSDAYNSLTEEQQQTVMSIINSMRNKK